MMALRLIGVTLWFSAQALAAPAVFVAESAEKLRPTAGARPLVPAHIYAARNEFEAFQIGVVGPATGVSAAATTLTGPGAPITEIRLYREGLIDCPQPSAPDGATGRWPDPLIPDKDEFDNQTRNAFPFDVPAAESRMLFVDVRVWLWGKPDLRAGTDSGFGCRAAAAAPRKTFERERRSPAGRTVKEDLAYWRRRTTNRPGSRAE